MVVSGVCTMGCCLIKSVSMCMEIVQFHCIADCFVPMCVYRDNNYHTLYHDSTPLTALDGASRPLLHKRKPCMHIYAHKHNHSSIA